MTISAWLAAHTQLPYAYLTTTGRTSGKPHRIEIWFAVDGDRILLMSGGRDRSDWVKNLLANDKVTVELGDQVHPGRAQVIPLDSVDDTIARNLLVAKYQKTDELADWRVRSLPIEIRFD